MHGAQHTAAFLGHIATTATFQDVQFTAIDIDTIVAAARGEAIVARTELNFGDFRLGVASKRYLGEPVVAAARRGGVGEVVHSDGARRSAHCNEGGSFIQMAATAGGLRNGTKRNNYYFEKKEWSDLTCRTIFFRRKNAKNVREKISHSSR